MKPHLERFLPYALRAWRRAAGVLVGSRHTAETLWGRSPTAGPRAKTRLGPPGVDTETFRPRRAAAGALAAAREVDDTAAAARPRTPARSAGPVVFVGKLIVSKGVDLLLAAWPLVAAAHPRGAAAARRLR